MASAPLSLARRMLFGRKASAIAEAGAGLGGVVPPRRRPFRVLAIDGGGIRGILPAMVLADLERRTNRPIIDLFDMIVGTSTGGLIALALACPGEGGRPRHTARDVIRLYAEQGKCVFSRSVWHKIRAVGT
jgi:patatin-like phospholipase/acyl hydrolase